MDKGRAGTELELTTALVIDRYTSDIVGQQIRGALQALERQAQRGGDGPGQHRLAGARHVFDQHVSFTEQGNRDQFDGLPLADDHALDVVDHGLGELLDLC